MIVVALAAATWVGAPRDASVSANGCELWNSATSRYEVDTRSDLDRLRGLNCYNKVIHQTTDIDLDGWSSPIDDWRGTFDGHGFSFFDSNRATPQPALFTHPGHSITIRNVHRIGDIRDNANPPQVGGFVNFSAYAITIEDSSMVGDILNGYQVGGLIGGVIGSTTITDSSVTGDVVGYVVGGLIGDGRDVEIADSSVVGDVNGREVLNGGRATGGFIGNATSTEITDSSMIGDVRGYEYTGGLVGYGDVSATIAESSVRGDVWGGDDFVGGFVGRISTFTTISESSMNGDVQGSGRKVGGLIGSSGTSITVSATSVHGKVVGDEYVGGLAGNGSNVSISTSSMNGDVTGDDKAGGFVGYVNATAVISESAMNGNVNGDEYVGGLAGYVEDTATISDSSMTGDVTGDGNVGGFIGYNNASPPQPSSRIEYSYKTGVVRGHSTVGGLIGRAASLDISRSYTTDDVFGVESVGGLVGSSVGLNGLAIVISIAESFTIGNVTGDQFVGGFVGDVGDSVTISDSYTAANVSAGVSVGGFVGYVWDIVTMSDSYTTGNVTGDQFVGGFVGDIGDDPSDRLDPSKVVFADVFCLAGATNCGVGIGAPPGLSTSATNLKSSAFLTGRGWDFSNKWRVLESSNHGYPILRETNFGPCPSFSYVNNCRARISVPIWRVSLDPAGGSCRDTSMRTAPWVSVFVGYRYLPAASDCTKPGHTFAGWADTTTPTVVRRLPLLNDPSDNVRRYFAAENLDLVAVWTSAETPETITDLVVFANFLCNRCTTAWLIYTSPPDITSVTITVDSTPVTCNQSGVVFGLSVCELINLTPGPHTVVVTPTGGASTSTTFTLRG